MKRQRTLLQPRRCRADGARRKGHVLCDPLTRSVRDRQIHRDREWIVVARGGAAGKRRASEQVRAPFQADDNVLELESGDIGQLCAYTKKHRVVHF